MPVWKYRSIEEMPEVRRVTGEMPLGKRIRAILGFGVVAGPLGMPRGVRKFRSLDEMAADRRRYESARIERIRASRNTK